MKKLFIAVLVLITLGNLTQAQYKSDVNKVSSTTNSLILGIFNPKNFSMKHSFQVSMLTSSYGTFSVTSYINSMEYKFSEKLKVSADVKLQYSPYANSYLGKGYSTAVQNDLTGLKLSRLSLDYKISENSNLYFEFRNLDGIYPYDRYYSPFFYNDTPR
ncbi:MAG: hypothetical protein ACP5P3_06035 [Ignavibacteria bacterium]